MTRLLGLRRCTTFYYDTWEGSKNGGTISWSFKGRTEFGTLCENDSFDPGGGGDLGEGGGGGPPDAQKERLREMVRKYPECAGLFGGLQKALELIDRNILINVDPASAQPVKGPDQDIGAAVVHFAENLGATVLAASTSKTDRNFMYVSDRYFTAQPPAQDTFRFHELQHAAGKGKEIDNQNYMKNFQEIIEKCKTGFSLGGLQ